jgi:membrane fusion protein (multidrug efflux system)
MAEAVADQQQPAGTQAENKQPEKKGMSPAVKWGIAIVLVAAIVIGGFLYWSYASVRESTDDAQIDGHIYPVAAQISGTIQDVLVDNNQVVQAGAILGHIDSRYYEAAVEKATGDVNEAKAKEAENRAGVPITSINTSSEQTGAEAGIEEQSAKIATAEQRVNQANERLVTVQARVREVQASKVKADSDLARMKPLVAKDEISKQQYDAVVAAADSAKASLDSANSQVAEAQQAVKVAQFELNQERAHMAEVRAQLAATKSAPQQIASKQALVANAAAQIQQKDAALQQAQIDLGYTILRAPVAGLVSQRSMEPGQTVSLGQALMAIVPLDDVWVTANFKESQLVNMKPGQSVDIEVDAYGRTYKGHVDSIAAATGARFSLLPPENATGNYVKVVQRVPVKIVFEKDQNNDHLLRPGMSVTPTVLVK